LGRTKSRALPALIRKSCGVERRVSVSRLPAPAKPFQTARESLLRSS
jgi:hypothetical protein